MTSTLRVFIYTAITTPLALATGIEQTYQDPSSAAKGNATVATIDQPSAVHYNPAGLVWATAPESQSTFYFNRGKVTHTGGSGGYTHYSSNPSFSYFFNYPGLANDRLALGFGMTVPFGLGVDLGDNYPLRTLGTESFLAHLQLSPAISYKITPKLSFGATINYAYDDYLLKQGIIVAGDEFKFEGTGDGWGYSAGLMYKPTEKWAFGINYRSSLKTSISGKSRTRTVLPFASDTIENASTGFDYPQQVVIGAAYKPNDQWTIEINAQWTDWTSFDTFEIFKPSGNLSAAQDYEDAYFVGLGISKKVNPATTLNCGYLFATPAAPSSTYNPLVPNANLHIFSIGIDRAWRNWQFSSALLYTYGESREINGSTVNPFSGASADGNWKSRGAIFMLGATKTF